MKPFLNILVGINYTEASCHALRKAVAIASQEGAKVTACHVLPVTDLNDYVNFYQIEHLNLVDEAKECLAGFVEKVIGPDHEVTCRVSEGSPHHEISSITNEEHFDLLVLGDGDDTDDTRDVGQFAIRCLRFVEIPVLIVNQADESPLPPVAACLDFSGSTKPILENAARLVTGTQPSLELIHAARPPWLRKFFGRLRDSSSENSGEKERFREAIDARLATAADQVDPGLFPEVDTTRLESIDPDRALLDYLAENEFSLVVLGRSGHGFKGLLSDVIGSTANDLIRNASNPILVVPLES
jgi:nucleotide-binding universal stress UspA family protein